MTQEDNKAPRINRTPTKTMQSIKSAVEKTDQWTCPQVTPELQRCSFQELGVIIILGGLLLLYHPFSCDYPVTQPTTGSLS